MLSDVGVPAINRDTTFTLYPFFLQPPRRPTIPECQGSLWQGGQGRAGLGPPSEGGWVAGERQECNLPPLPPPGLHKASCQHFP